MTTLALALCLLWYTSEPKLLRGDMTTCGWVGPWPWVSGVLLLAGVSGTALKVDGGWGQTYLMPPTGSIVPVMWPADVSGHWLPDGEVEIKNAVDTVAVRTGTRVTLAPPVPIGNNRNYQEGEPFPACEARELAAGEQGGYP